ncbi:MAG: hypothetical protein SFX73_39755 [Kofleriaceae bacterium]|nr:hypothetical protein [Kofleriaceae bacterium]
MRAISSLIYVLVASAMLACGAGGATGPTPGVYCFNCQGVTRVTFTYVPSPAHAEVAKVNITFPGCPDAPTTLPLAFDNGFVVDTMLRPEASSAKTGFASGELQIEQCSMEHLRAGFWLQREDGSRIEGRVDVPLRVESP